MTWSADKTQVNSWNEWDPLRHVIVGRADDCHILPAEPALDAKVPEDSDMRGMRGKRPQETIDRANELLAKPRLTDAVYHPDYLSEKIGNAQRLKNGLRKNSLSQPWRNRCLMPPTCCALARIWWCNTVLPPI